MPIPHPPQWHHTHASWTALKSKHKTMPFPETGTGKTLDKLEALYKKINWSQFDLLTKDNMEEIARKSSKDILRDMGDMHWSFIEPFRRAVREAAKAIKTAPGMPGAGKVFALQMEASLEAFHERGTFFTNLWLDFCKQLDKYRQEKRKAFENVALFFKTATLKDYQGNPGNRNQFMEHIGDTRSPALQFVYALWHKKDPAKIYDFFITSKLLSLPPGITKPLAEKHAAKTLALADFDPAYAHVYPPLGAKAFENFLRQKYTKYGLAKS